MRYPRLASHRLYTGEASWPVCTARELKPKTGEELSRSAGLLSEVVLTLVSNASEGMALQEDLVLQTTLERHAAIEQAKGAVAAQLAVSAEEAFQALPQGSLT